MSHQFSMRSAGSPRIGSTDNAGFTLVELVMTMLVIAILAAVALPKMTDTSLWGLRAYSDSVASELQSARRMALAQRRPIVATVSSTGVTLAYAAGGSIATLACPSGANPCIAETGSITFNAGHSGSTLTSAGAVFTITISGGSSFSRQLRVDAETGHIQALS